MGARIVLRIELRLDWGHSGCQFIPVGSAADHGSIVSRSAFSLLSQGAARVGRKED
jgi:hypothetical protein